MPAQSVADNAGRRRGPLAGNYWATVVLVVCALVPYLVLSSALGPLQAAITADAHLPAQTYALGDGLANAGYALGTVLAVQLAHLFPPRRMLVVYAVAFVIGSALAASATAPAPYLLGHIVQGLATSLMLIGAVPPLASGFPASRLPTTAVVLGLGLFGAVAAGPVVGGVVAGGGNWRLMFWIVAAVGAAAVLMTLLTFDDEPPEPEHRADPAAVALAGLAAIGIFAGTAELQTHPFTSGQVLVPLLIGIALLLALLVDQWLTPDPLIPIRALCTTVPVAATVAAMSAAAASVGVIELVQLALTPRGTPTHVGLLFLPVLGGAFVGSVLLGVLLKTKWLPVLTIAGMVLVTLGSGVLAGAADASETVVLVGLGLLGLGVGCSVAPALLFAGFARPPTEVQRVYAMLEYLRGVAGFAFAPIALYLAIGSGSGDAPAPSTATGVWVCCGVAAGGTLLTALIWFTGRPRWQAPDIARWQGRLSPGLDTPPLAAALRRHHIERTST